MIYGVLGLLSVVITGFALLVTGLFMISGQMGWINDLATGDAIALKCKKIKLS